MGGSAHKRRKLKTLKVDTPESIDKKLGLIERRIVLKQEEIEELETRLSKAKTELADGERPLP